jgi:hypothetical protein
MRFASDVAAIESSRAKTIEVADRLEDPTAPPQQPLLMTSAGVPLGAVTLTVQLGSTVIPNVRQVVKDTV